MVLVVLPNLDNIFFSRILRGIEEVLFEAGYGMIIGDLDGAREKEARFAAFASAGQVDSALLLNGHLFGQSRDGKGPAMKTTVPLVALCEAIPGADIPQIEVDNRAAARRMTRNISLRSATGASPMCGPADNVLERERFRGYRDGLREEGIASDPDLVLPGDYSLEAGAAAGRIVAGLPARPTAVFCSNDEMAMGLMRGLISAGVQVPQDVSVAGFDDIEFAAMAQPPLTTVRQPRRELGRAGAHVLIDLLQGGPPRAACGSRPNSSCAAARRPLRPPPRNLPKDPHERRRHRHRRQQGHGRRRRAQLHDRGYRLALMARSQDVETLADELGGLAVRGSVTETADLERIVRAALDRFGRIDAVVNHTGHPPKGDLLAIPDGDWHLGLGMVLMNVVRMARLVTPFRGGTRGDRQRVELRRFRTGCGLSGLVRASNGARSLPESSTPTGMPCRHSA